MWDRWNAPLMREEAFARRAEMFAAELADEFARYRSDGEADAEAFVGRVRRDLEQVEEVSGRDDAAAQGMRIFLETLEREPV